jgi:hypothetical protein
VPAVLIGRDDFGRQPSVFLLLDGGVVREGPQYPRDHTDGGNSGAVAAVVDLLMCQPAHNRDCLRSVVIGSEHAQLQPARLRGEADRAPVVVLP